MSTNLDPAVALRLAGKRYPEIAAALGIHRATARLRVERAVRRGLVSAQAARYRARQGMSDEEYDRRWLERLRAQTIVAENGCHVWQGAVGTKGYIMLQHRKYRVNGHRIAYLLLTNRDLKHDDLVCHSCDNRLCWNQEHLWIGAPADNSLDMVLKGRCQQFRVTHCPKGHPYDETNTTYVEAASGRKSRQCKECTRIRNRERYHADPELTRQKRREQRERVKARKSGVQHV